MRNAAVIFISPGSTGLNRSLETLNIFLTPSCFSEELLLKDSQRQKTGQVGLVQAPPARPFFKSMFLGHCQILAGLAICFCNILIIAVCFHGLNRGNKHPKVGRVGQGRKQPCPATDCLHVVTFYDIRIKTSCFYVLCRRISSPPNGYPLTKLKGSDRVPLLRAPVRADF